MLQNLLHRRFTAARDNVIHGPDQAAFFFRFTTCGTIMWPDLPSRKRASAKMASTL